MFCYTEEELNKLKSEEKHEGYSIATDTLRRVLNGEKNLFIAGEINRITGFQERASIHDPSHKDNPWKKLLDILDKDKK